MDKFIYEKPQNEELGIVIEQGFANSIEDPDEKPELEW